MTAPALADWSFRVRHRDGACRVCGATERLHAHHILPKSTHPELSLDPDNGITLCHRCHRAEHAKRVVPRIHRGRRPQRRTLERLVAHLQTENAALRAQVMELQAKVREATAWGLLLRS